ncbi:hypothetical protein TNCV_4963041 [Trichonephila clavipes]|nr:hypothetical protein TNCV_4963041 [Trichonephila clavipes]
MRQAVWAVSAHTSSTDDEPKHWFFPTGKNSWYAWTVVGTLEWGQTQAEVAQAIGVSQSVISGIWNRFLETGSAG